MAKYKDSKVFEISGVNDTESLPEDAWKVRPCEWYKDEYKECSSIKARFHQYYIYGETVDCSHWKKDYEQCKNFRDSNDLNSLANVIESENKRFQSRKTTAIENDVWQYRDSPPENWNSPLPEWMLEKKKDSLLIETQKALNEGTTPSQMFTGISCTIM